MKKTIYTLLLLVFSSLCASAQSPSWGVGLRLGDPTGISLKHYIHDGRNAFEFSIGRSYPYAYAGYKYDDAFYHIDKFSDKNIYAYDHYYLDNALAMQLHWMVQRGFNSDILSQLKWYIGAGAQLRTAKVDYYYRYKYYFGPDKNDYEWRYDHSLYVSTAVGVDGVIGLEYTFKEVPVSVFADVTLYLEAFPQPFLIGGQEGAGVRYNFSMSSSKPESTPEKKKK